MVAIEEICIKCGNKFIRGIYPQKRCDFCSINKSYTLTEKRDL